MMLTVKIKKPIYIRKGPGVSYEAIGVIYPSGNDVGMEGVETGETLKGINEWLYKTNDKGEKQYYWRGGSGDTEAVFQWGIQALGVDQVWARGIKGEKVKVAIIDTGIDLNNPFLSHAVVDGFNVLTGQNYASNPLCIQDTYGHGSSCASILAGSHQGMHPGIAPACELIVIKVADDEDDLDVEKNLPAAINKAAALGAEVITICCGIKASTPNVDAVIQNIWHKHIFVAAAGNKASGVDSPANLKGMISVGAITLEGGDSGYKTGNYGIPSQHPKGKSLGEGITIMAPGAGIKAYWQNNVSQYFDGTSAATPFVAGVVALLLSDLKHRQISTSSLSLHSHIRQKLITTAFQTNASGDRKLWGNGILDARKFVID